MLFLTIRMILIRINLKGIWSCLLLRNWCSCFCSITIPCKISLNPPINLPSMCQWMNETLLRLIENTQKKFIFEVLEYRNTFIVIFNLWISKVGVDRLWWYDFMNDDWEHGHVTINLFETLHIYGTTMALQVKKVLITSIMLKFFYMSKMKVSIFQLSWLP
jgi:hypothetical protein